MAGPCSPHAGSVHLSGCSDRAGSRRQAACEQGWGALFSLEWVGEAASPNWGACPPPLHRWTSRLQQSAPGAAAGPSRSKPWPWGRLPRHPLLSSQHLWRLRARTQAWGPLSGPCGHPRHGLGLPCPACLLPGSAWVPISRRGGGCGTHRPYLGCLSVSPQKALWGLAGWPCMYLSYILPHMGQTGVPRPEGQPDFLPLRPKHHRSNGGHSPELRVGFHTQPSSSTRRLGRGGLSEPPGSWAGVAHGGSRAWGRGAALSALEEVAGGPMGTPAEREAGQAVGLPPQALGPHQDPSSGPLRGTVSCS